MCGFQLVRSTVFIESGGNSCDCIMPGVKSFSSISDKMEKSRVCRCLFGAPDRGVIRKDLDESLRKSRTDRDNKWNFNFAEDIPLKGRYEWDVVESNEYVPAFYRKEYVPSKRVSLQRIPRLGLSQKSEIDSDSALSLKDLNSNASIVDSASDLSDLGCEPLPDSDDEESSHVAKCNKNSETVSNTSDNTRTRNLVQKQMDGKYKCVTYELNSA